MFVQVEKTKIRKSDKNSGNRRRRQISVNCFENVQKRPGTFVKALKNVQKRPWKKRVKEALKNVQDFRFLKRGREKRFKMDGKIS